MKKKTKPYHNLHVYVDLGVFDKFDNFRINRRSKIRQAVEDAFCLYINYCAGDDTYPYDLDTIRSLYGNGGKKPSTKNA